MSYKNIASCRICKNKKLKLITKLPDTPLADRFIDKPTNKEKYFPLELKYCNRCNLVQLGCDVDNELLFGDNYGFYTGASPSSVLYFKQYTAEILSRYYKLAKNFTLEIASNDGTLLKYFQKAGCRVLGVDPAQNVVAQANINGIHTLGEFFNKRFVKLWDIDKPTLILANNVIAHVDDLDDFIGSVKELLHKDGVFVFECQYLPNFIFKNEFDHMYHEHRSFFSLHPLIILMKRHGLKIFHVEQKQTQGGSIRVHVCHNNKRKTEDSVYTTLKYEEHIGITRPEIYDAYKWHIKHLRIQLLVLLETLREQGKKVVGYGASAKSNTMIHALGLTSKLLPYIVDKTPYKIGKYTPGTHIPVVDDSDKNTKDVDYYLLFVWNYFDGIIKRETKFRKRGGKFIIPVPTPFIV